jgi:thioredoxin 2
MAIFRCKACGAMNRVAEGRRGDHPVCGNCKARLDTEGSPQEVVGEAFERAIASSPVPVLVDFWAEWCGPCRMAAPAVAELARRNAGQVLVLKVNVDADNQSAGRFRVQSIPAFVLFHQGREVARRVGLASRADLERWIAGSTAANAGGTPAPGAA